MVFYDLDKRAIKEHGVLKSDDLYEYCLGSKVEVTSLRKKHVNDILAKNLSSQVKEDKMMVRYYPSNKILFKKDFIESSSIENFSSCFVSKESCSVIVGNTEDFPLNSGILTFSGVLSLNNKIERDRIIFCNSQMDEYARKKIKVLACGIRDNKLLALFYIPSERGLAVSCNTGGMALSAKSYMIKNYDSWDTFTINDWFEGVMIREI